MELRPVDRSGLSIISIGVGSGGFGRLEEQASFRVMDHAFEKGITFLDTAELYSNSESERIIGDWMHRRRKRTEITLLTKSGLVPDTSLWSWGDSNH